MFLRRTTYRMAPEFDTAEGQKEFHSEMRANLFPQPGLVSSTHTDNGDGTYLVVSVWHDKSYADDALPKIEAEWARQRHKLAEDPTIELLGTQLVENF